MKADEQLKCKDCDWYGSCEYYDRRKETSQICKMFNNTWKFVAELEKIKAEFYKCRDYIICNHNHTEADMNKLDGLVLAISITDERISELKGE